MVDTTATFDSFNEDIDSLHGSLRPEVLLADAMQFEVCDLGRRKKPGTSDIVSSYFSSTVSLCSHGERFCKALEIQWHSQMNTQLSVPEFVFFGVFLALFRHRFQPFGPGRGISSDALSTRGGIQLGALTTGRTSRDQRWLWLKNHQEAMAFPHQIYGLAMVGLWISNQSNELVNVDWCGLFLTSWSVSGCL